MLVLLVFCYKGVQLSRPFLGEPHLTQKNRATCESRLQGGRGRRCDLALSAEPTAEERKAAQDMLKDSPVGQMAGSMGEDGAQGFYQTLAVVFGFLVLATGLVLSGAVGGDSDTGAL